MNKRRNLFFIVISILLYCPPAPSQIDVSSATAKTGLTRTLWTDAGFYSGHLWRFYPELEIGGHFFVPYLTWGVSWSYWSDGIDQVLPVMDMVTYSFRSHVVAVRVGFQPQRLDREWTIPVTIFVGAAEHFIRQKYIGGLGYSGEGGEDSNKKSMTAIVGLGYSIHIVSCVSLLAEGLQFIPLGDDEIDRMQKNRRSFSLGVAVAF